MRTCVSHGLATSANRRVVVLGDRAERANAIHRHGREGQQRRRIEGVERREPVRGWPRVTAMMRSSTTSGRRAQHAAAATSAYSARSETWTRERSRFKVRPEATRQSSQAGEGRAQGLVPRHYASTAARGDAMIVAARASQLLVFFVQGAARAPWPSRPRSGGSSCNRASASAARPASPGGQRRPLTHAGRSPRPAPRDSPPPPARSPGIVDLQRRK